jgi:hypothetical protein
MSINFVRKMEKEKREIQDQWDGWIVEPRN